MATRSTIRIEGFDLAKIYKHWDGYPSVMLPWLESFNQEFESNRSNDPPYKFAQLLRNSTCVDEKKYTGWGVVTLDSTCCAEYEYTLHVDGTVTYQQL